jgi:DNA-binding transcriptional LysR family regulator
MNPDLRAMRQFVAVAEELHFGRAARRLGMAQPPLSQAIRRLEEALGCPLFERTRRKVELTAAGRVYRDEAKRTLVQAEEAVRLARRAASDDLALLSVGFVSAALYRVLPAVLRAHRARFPDVEIRLDERATDLQVGGLQDGSLDLGFVTPPVQNASGLTIETISRERFILAVPASGPFRDRGEVPLAELAPQSFVFFPHVQGPALHGRVMSACREAGFLPRIVQEARQMHTVLSLVAAGLGVSLVPEGARTMRVEGVRFVGLIGAPEDMTWDLALAWKPRGARRALLSLITTVRTCLAEPATGPR